MAIRPCFEDNPNMGLSKILLSPRHVLLSSYSPFESARAPGGQKDESLIYWIVILPDPMLLILIRILAVAVAYPLVCQASVLPLKEPAAV